MRTFRLIVTACLLAFVLASPHAEEAPDYSTIKGDFKIFCLGDSQETVKSKIDYLEAQKITEERYAPLSCVVSVFGESMFCGFQFYQDQLQEIRLSSWRGHTFSNLDGGLKDLLMQRIRPSFIDLYGKPTNDYGYPTVLDLQEGWTRYVSIWALPKKTISIGLNQYKFKLYAVISIRDNALTAARKAEEDAQKQQQDTASKGDF